MEPNIM